MYKIHNHGWVRHCQTQNPLNDVGRFIHECAEDRATRVMSTTALVLALCQTAGPALIGQPPGFLLVNASGEANDPIDDVMKTLTGMIKPAPRPAEETFERNCRTMEAMLVMIEKEQGKFRPAMQVHGVDPNTSRLNTMEGAYGKALSENFGSGRAGWYADRYDERFGWIADETNHTILRLDREPDLLALRCDVRTRPELFADPKGCGSTMRRERKTLSLAGSLTVSEWDDNLAVCIVENAFPVLFLPHTASMPLVTPGELALDWIGIGLATEACSANTPPVTAWDRLAPLNPKWIGERIDGLRQRLQHFPADYDFFVMRTVRELLNCCQRLVIMMSTGRSSLEEKRALLMDLYTMTLQGISLGVEALGWHGYGFDSSCDRANTLKVLRAIRDRGSISKRDLLRNQQWLTAESRDAILAAFEGEGIIAVTDNQVSALPFTDYWRGVLHRAGRNMPPPLWKTAAGEAATTAN